MKGIDVSTIQGVIDWAKVADSGVKFAMIKATQGRGEGATTRLLRRFTDSRFERNIKAASAAGIACGVYHYMTAKNVTEAVEEAEYFCTMIEPYRDRITLWAAVDVESEMYLTGIARHNLAEIVEKFMEVVRKRCFKPMLYTNPNYIKYRLPAGAFDRSEIWLAHYGVDEPMEVPNTRIWQKGTGRIPGIPNVCDINEGYFSEAVPAIAKLAALGVINTPEYWIAHYNDDPYLGELLVKSADKITSAGEAYSDISIALERLNSVGVVNTPAYWVANAPKVRYLTELICKLGGCV